MMRLSLFLTTMLTTFLASMLVRDLTDEREISVSAALQQDQRISEMSVRYYHFKAVFQTTLDALRGGAIGLREARARVRAVARDYNPNYLVHVANAEVGANDEERLARNLVAHVRYFEEAQPNPNSHLLELETELDELVCAMHNH